MSATMSSMVNPWGHSRARADAAVVEECDPESRFDEGGLLVGLPDAARAAGAHHHHDQGAGAGYLVGDVDAVDTGDFGFLHALSILGLESVPRPEIVTETRWPAVIGPTPSGVPVRTSPGSSVITGRSTR